MYARGEIVLSGSWWLYLFALLGMGLAIVMFYGRVTTTSTAIDRAVLSATRTAVLAVLLLALFQPVLVVSNPASRTGVVGILLDDSLSMRVPDHEGEPRANFTRMVFQPEEGAVTQALSRRFELRFFRFAERAEPLAVGDSMDFSGRRTDLAKALESVREELSRLPAAALVVVSDGAITEATPLDEVLSDFQSAGIPITVVSVGQTSFLRDVEITRVSMPRRTLKGTSIVADVVLTHTGYDNERVKLLVEDDGQLVAVEEFDLIPNQPTQTVRMRFTVREGGSRQLRFHVSPFADELLGENNVRHSVLSVEDRRERILYFEGEPRFELKFIRRAVAKDDNLQVVSLLRTAENKFYRLGIDESHELAGGFPERPEELFGYRGVILGSIEASYFSGDQLQLIADFVSRRGGGLLVLGGSRALARGGYATTPVAELLPVILEAKRMSAFRADVLVQPTPAGRSHALARLAPEGTVGLPWERLPPLTVLHPLYRARPGASTLLEGRAPGLPAPITILAEQRFGRGRTLVLNVQNSWQWQMHRDMPLEDQTHETLWRQLLRWLVQSVPERITINVGSGHVSPNETVEISAEVLDASFTPLNNTKVQLVLTTPIGDRLSLPMAWDPSQDGVYRARFSPEHTGVYEATVEGRFDDGTLTSTVPVPVGAVTPDHYGAQMREVVLRRVAEHTGGRFYTSADVSSLADEIPTNESGPAVVERLPLWDVPAGFLLLLTMIGFEWVYRRSRGLV